MAHHTAPGSEQPVNSVEPMRPGRSTAPPLPRRLAHRASGASQVRIEPASPAKAEAGRPQPAGIIEIIDHAVLLGPARRTSGHWRAVTKNPSHRSVALLHNLGANRALGESLVEVRAVPRGSFRCYPVHRVDDDGRIRGLRDLGGEASNQVRHCWPQRANRRRAGCPGTSAELRLRRSRSAEQDAIPLRSSALPCHCPRAPSDAPAPAFGRCSNRCEWSGSQSSG